MKNYYVSGQWNAVCDRCGFEYKSGQLRQEWTGLMVCKGCWEPRHPQTMIQVPQDESAIPWSRPEPTDVYVDPWLLTEDTYLPLDITTEGGLSLSEE